MGSPNVQYVSPQTLGALFNLFLTAHNQHTVLNLFCDAVKAMTFQILYAFNMIEKFVSFLETREGNVLAKSSSRCVPLYL